MTTPATPPLTPAGQLLSRFFTIELREATQSDLVWDTGSTGANAPAAFWKVSPAPGFFALGHMVTTVRPRGVWTPPHALTLAPRDGHDDLLAEPDGVEKVWDDAGTGSDRDLHVWRLRAPAGYVALGDIVSAEDEPDLRTVRCVKETAVRGTDVLNLVTRANFRNNAAEGETSAVPFWNDAGTGANADISVWLMQVDNTPGTGQIYLSPGTFHANDRGQEPPARTPRALVLDFPQPDILEPRELADRKVLLTGRRLPTEAELQNSKVVDEYWLPFFAVRDPDHATQLDQFRASPAYRVVRTTEYEALDSFAPINTETKEYTVTVGTSSEENYSNDVGVALGLAVEVGGEAGIAVAKTSMKVTASVEVSYSHTWGGATSRSEEKSFTYPQSVTGGSFGALFQAKSSYVVHRLDGTRLGPPVEVRTNELYTDEWPRPTAAAAASSTGGTNQITFTIDAPPGKVVILEGRLEIRDGQITQLPQMGIFPSVERTARFAPDATPIPLAAQLPPTYTKEAWIKPTNPTREQNILSDGTGTGHALWLTDGKVSAGHNGRWTDVTDPEPATAQWEHHAITYDAAIRELRLYRDGALVGTATGVAPPGSSGLLVGGYSKGPVFEGELADVRVWDVVRSPGQIDLDRWKVVPAGTAGLIARYPA